MLKLIQEHVKLVCDVYDEVLKQLARNIPNSDPDGGDEHADSFHWLEREPRKRMRSGFQRFYGLQAASG